MPVLILEVRCPMDMCSSVTIVAMVANHIFLRIHFSYFFYFSAMISQAVKKFVQIMALNE